MHAVGTEFVPPQRAFAFDNDLKLIDGMVMGEGNLGLGKSGNAPGHGGVRQIRPVGSTNKWDRCRAFDRSAAILGQLDLVCLYVVIRNRECHVVLLPNPLSD